MPVSAATAAERVPRRARYLIPRDNPRRGEIVAAFVVVVLLGHLLVAQLTVVATGIFYAAGKAGRWRLRWLAVPAGAGLVWALAIGPARAVRGFIAGPRQVLSYLGGVPGSPGRLLHLGGAFAGLAQWLPRQLPLALIAGAAEAAFLLWLSWLHADGPAARPGLVVVVRRRYLAANVRAGGVVTRDGAVLGIDQAAGSRAAISWREAEGGVLAAGAAALAGAGPGLPGSRLPGPGAPWLAAPAPGPAVTSFQLVHAAIRRRKPVIAVDLTGSSWLAGSLAAVCADAGAPLHQFGEAGQSCYEPLRGGDPVRAASLARGMIDWTGITDQHRRRCAAYLSDVFAVAAAAPGDPGEPVLDDVARLLSPGALRARLARVPAHYPRRDALAERITASASLAEADPAALPVIAGQLTALRTSSAGRWLRPGTERIVLGQVLRERAACLFTLDQGVHGSAAAMIAGLVAADALALFAELRGIPVSGDGLAWFSGCEAVDLATLAELVGRGSQAGMTVLLTTTSETAAASLAGVVNVLAIHQLADPERAGQLAAAAASAGAGAAPGAGPGAAWVRSAPAAGPPVSPPLLVPPVPGVPPALGPQVPAAPGLASAAPVAPAAVPDWAQPAAPDWARRMPVPAVAGTSAAAGSVALAAGPAAGRPFGIMGSPAVTADSLLGLPGDAFTLVVRGPGRRVIPLCRAMPAQLPASPA